MKNIFLASATAIIILSACNRQSTAHDTTADTNLATDTLKYEKKSEIFETTIIADYPTDNNSIVANSVREFISEELGGTYNGPLENGDSLIKTYGEKIFSTNVEELKDYCGESTGTNFSTCEIKKGDETKKYVTYIVSQSNYMGGAHGMYSDKGVTFRKTDGRRFGYSVMKSTQLTEFNELLKEGLRDYFSEYKGEPINDEELNEELIVCDDLENLPRPVCEPYITAKGVTFIYQPYEISYYAAGAPTFTVPYSKIKPFLMTSGRSYFD